MHNAFMFDVRDGVNVSIKSLEAYLCGNYGCSDMWVLFHHLDARVCVCVCVNEPNKRDKIRDRTRECT